MPATKPLRIPITDVRLLAEKHKLTGAIVLGFDLNTGQVCGTSYGENREQCAALGRVLDTILGAIRRGEIEP